MTRVLDTTPLPWHRERWQQAVALFKSGSAGHAYLLSGEADTGKRYFAMMLAEYLLCRQPSAEAACARCSVCLLNAAGNNPDMLSIEPEEGSKQIKVDQIREIRQFLETRSHGFGKRDRCAAMQAAMRLHGARIDRHSGGYDIIAYVADHDA